MTHPETPATGMPGPPPRALDLLLLTSAAGVLDGLSHLRAGVFTANMTGNTVLLGLALAGNNRYKAFPCVLALCGFATGALLAALLLAKWVKAEDSEMDLAAGIGLELPFLAAAALILTFAPGPGAWTDALILSAGCALGIQSVAVRRLRVSGVVTTFITGTITTAILSLVAETSGRRETAERGSPALLAAMFAAYVLSAAAGAILFRFHASIAAATLVVVVAAAEIRSVYAIRRR